MTTNYVVAAYFGDRKRPTKAYQEDCTSYLIEHFRSLERLKHHLDQITVVCSWNAGPDPAFRLQLPDRVGTARVRRMHRKNFGMSYGAFSDAVALWNERFDATILMEDDYTFTQDHFDDLLLGMMKKKSCGFLCGESRPLDDYDYNVAAVFTGVAHREALSAATHLGPLPYDHTSASYVGGCAAQKEQSAAFQKAGQSVEDWLDRYATAYYDAHYDGSEGIVRWFGDKYRPAFVMPVQVLDRPVLVDIGGEMERRTIERDGRFS